MDSNDHFRNTALKRLEEHKDLDPLIPRFFGFVVDRAVVGKTDLTTLRNLMNMLQSLFKNRALAKTFQRHQHIVIQSIGQCAASSFVPAHSKDGAVDHWSVRDLAIQLMTSICARDHLLTKKVAMDYVGILKDYRPTPLVSVYGIVAGLASLGPEFVESGVLPNMGYISQLIDFELEQGIVEQKVAERVRGMIIRSVTPVLRKMKPHPLKEEFGSLAPYFPGLLYANEKEITNYNNKQEISNSFALNKASAPLQSKSVKPAPLQSKSVKPAPLQSKSVKPAPLQSKSAASNSALLYQIVKGRKSVISEAPANAAGDGGAASSADMKLAQVESASKRLRMDQLPKQRQQETVDSQQESRSSTPRPATSDTPSTSQGDLYKADPGLEAEIKVYRIGDYVTERMMRALFGKYGTVVAVHFPKKKNGSCHVMLSTSEEAQMCIKNVHGKKYKSRTLEVTSAIVKMCLREEDAEGFTYCQEHNICLNYNTNNAGCTVLGCLRRHICRWCHELDGTEEPHRSRFKCPQKTESYVNTPVPDPSRV